jgi:predicted nucleic acid-binding protein
MFFKVEDTAKKGTKIPINDVWIAASCMEVGGTLLTKEIKGR